jgi:hypothetical protein
MHSTDLLLHEWLPITVRETLINSLTRAGLAWSGAVRAETMDPSR